MAYLVLLSFEDDAQAKTFVEDVLEYPEAAILTPVQENEVHAEVCGVFRQPTLFCECTGATRGVSGKLAYAYRRGQKYGWWVHVKCGKPSKVAGYGATRWELAVGTNLLPVEVSPELWKGRIKGWQSPVEWRFLVPKTAEENSADSVDSTLVTTI